jgi:hypothetical protein
MNEYEIIEGSILEGRMVVRHLSGEVCTYVGTPASIDSMLQPCECCGWVECRCSDAPEEPEPSVETGHCCELCGCETAAYAVRAGHTLIWNCRNCGMTSYFPHE